MAGYDRNSEWERRTLGRLTDRGLVGKALGNETAFRTLMKRYRGIVTGYLEWFLLRHKLVPDDKAGAEAAVQIWGELITAMPAKLAEKWNLGGTSFRDLLLEGTHEAYFAWHKRNQYKPPIMGLVTPGQEDNQEFYRKAREDLLGKAREKLKSYQREQEGKKNLYHIVFCLWDDHRDERYDSLNARLAAMTGRPPLDSRNFRKTLNRAQDKFGSYLFDEVAAWVAQHRLPSQEEYRRAFEELDLMDDYVMKSIACRELLGIDIEDAEDGE
jgi:hypothetical protein